LTDSVCDLFTAKYIAVLYRTFIAFILISVGHAATAQDTLMSDDSTRSAFGDTVVYERADYRLNKAYFLSYFHDLGHVVTSPLRWKSREWGNFAVFTGVTGAALAADWEIRRIVQGNQNRLSTETSKIVEPFGNLYGVYLFPAMYVVGLAAKDRRIQSVALGGTKSLAISTLIYATTKTLIRRNRPDKASSSFDFAPPFQRKSFTSSPSGHSNTIFTVATALALEFRETKWVPIVAYTIATLTAASRIYQNRHWTSDVVVGSALGHFVTRAVWKNNNKKKVIKQIW
jgi:membrane-associated phospholipid phosphatase